MNRDERHIEDIRLITGRGRFTDDLPSGDALHAVFVRADRGSSTIVSIEKEEARAMPGVVAVLTADDLKADGIGPVQVAMALAGPDGETWTASPRPLLCGERIRHLAEPVAIVLATSRFAAADAAEAVMIEYEDLPSIVSIADARADGAPLLWDDRPGNVALRWRAGEHEAVRHALAAVHRVVTIDTRITRVMAAPMEPRSAFAVPAGRRMELTVSHQNPPAFRKGLAAAFSMAPENVRVIAQDVGGAFGMKSGLLREEMLIFWAARRLNRPVRWTATRNESFLSDEAGRDVEVKGFLALDQDGHFQALHVAMDLDIGAYASARSLPPILNFGGIAGVYRTPLISGEATGYFTNKTPVAAYRGAGRPEAAFAIEHLVDKAAREMGIHPLELRRRNLIPSSAMPWKSPFLFDYDCGEFERVMDAAIVRADVRGFEARRRASAERGKLRGIGFAFCIETAGGPYSNPGREHAFVEIDGKGRLRVGTGAFSAGQGLGSTMTGIAARAMDIVADGADYVQGDTDLVPEGSGMGGSSAAIAGGSAVAEAAVKVLEKGKEIAAATLAVAPESVIYDAGTFRVSGSNKTLSLSEVANLAAATGTPLRADTSFAPDRATFPNGCHICEAEIDIETGETAFVAYTGVEDIGRVLQPQIATGQVEGGVAQGLSQVLLEEVRYDGEDAQLLSGTFMDYGMARASDLPEFETGFEEVPTALNPLGVKGVGEAGTVGGLAAGFNAVCNALASAGVDDFDMPATPARVWAALRKARSR